MSEQPWTDREIALIEEIGCLKRYCQISDTVFLALCVRLGGDVKIENDEMDYTRKSYDLTTDLSVSDFSRSIRLRARLK
jgi:hypothetical protein